MYYSKSSVPRRVAWIDTNNSTEYHDVTSSNKLRKGRPYKILSDPGESAVNISVHLPVTSGVKDVKVTVNHCSTTGEVRIYFMANGVLLSRGYQVANSDDFSEHTFNVPLNTIKTGTNIMVLGLNEESQGEYLLSDLNIRTVVESKTCLKTTDTSSVELIKADEDRDGEGRLCKTLKTSGESAAIFKFHLPSHQQVHFMKVTLNWFGTDEMIDILVNDEILVEQYTVASSSDSDEQTFSIPGTMLRAGVTNRLVVRLNKESRGSYWVTDLIKLNSVVTNVIWIDTNNTEKYIQLETSEMYRNGRPYKIFTTPGISCAHILIHLPDKKHVQDMVLTLNHCRTTGDGSIDILVNGMVLLKAYNEAYWKNFQEQTFPIPEHILRDGTNVLTIRLNKDSTGVYWLSDLKIEY